jgi:hypothetical protein
MSKKVMKLIDPYSGRMQCKICGMEHVANLAPGGFYRRGSWQCIYGCKFEDDSTQPKSK